MYWFDGLKEVNGQVYIVVKYFNIYSSFNYKDKEWFDLEIKTWVARDEEEFLAYYLINKKL